MPEKVYYLANYVISLEKISHRTCTVIRFTTTLKISEALHDVSNATVNSLKLPFYVCYFVQLIHFSQ